MALYFVDYDLREHHDYQELYDALEELNAKRVLESSWCLKHDDISVKWLRDHLKQFIHKGDGLCVMRANGWATYNVKHNPYEL